MRQQNKVAWSAVLALLTVQAALAHTTSTTGAQSATTVTRTAASPRLTSAASTASQASPNATAIAATGSTSATPATSATHAATTTTPALVPIPLTDQLTSLTETLRRLAHATSQLQAQYNQHGPDIDELIMDPVMSGNPGLTSWAATSGPALPADPKWVAYSVTELNKLNGMLIEELLKIKQSSVPDDKMKVQLMVLDDSAEQLKSDCLRLQNLTQTNLNDRKDVLKICQSLKDDISGINEIRKRMIRLLKPD
jgi:hypothetical protein